MKYQYFMHFFLIISLFNIQTTFSASSSNNQQNNEIIKVLAIGGQNTLGSKKHYVASQLGIGEAQIDRSDIPNGWVYNGIDLGQNVCIKNFATLMRRNENNNIIIHATSQGTATALNCVAQLSEKKQQKVKAIILEATLASGNSAIMHTATQMGLPILNDLPASYYWAPYVAKALFPRYCPAGKQAIKSIQNISNNIPIIIIHSLKDRQLSFNDARALYYKLRHQGNQNVYFVQKEGSSHINIMGSDNTNLIRTILGSCGVLQTNKSLSAQEKNDLQPNIAQHAEAYNNLISKEKKHEYLWYTGAACALYGLYRFAKPRVTKFLSDKGINSFKSLINWLKPS